MTAPPLGISHSPGAPFKTTDYSQRNRCLDEREGYCSLRDRGVPRGRLAAWVPYLHGAGELGSGARSARDPERLPEIPR